ncbi:MAG: hypothetical protein U0169_00090 [Polyangiaceae bacterium]
MHAVSATESSSAGDVFRTLVRARALRMVIVLLAMWFVLGAHPDTREAFLTAGNFSNLTTQVAEIVVIGVGMTLVILVGGIDLSVGAGMALTGVVAAKLQIDHHQPAWVAVLAAVGVATVVGAWHGWLVTRLAIPPFVATLSGFLAYRGLGIVLADARGLAPMGDDFAVLASNLPVGFTRALVAVAALVGVALVVRRRQRRAALSLHVESLALVALRVATILAAATFAIVVYAEGMPVPVFVAAIAATFGAILLRKTRFGRHAIAIGGNAEAARLSGVPVERVKMGVYVLTGILTALAGMIAAARTNGVTPGNAGLTRELHVITAVVIGGTSLTGGGRATMLGTVVGALVFGTLSNGMNLKNVDSNWQQVLTGAILLAAALLDSLSSQKKR